MGFKIQLAKTIQRTQIFRFVVLSQQTNLMTIEMDLLLVHSAFKFHKFTHLL